MSPTSGSGTGTPIGGGGIPSPATAALPLPYTLLSLPRYAVVMGINPAHFQRAHAESLPIQVFPTGSCQGLWPRYSWQNNDQVSHEELALAIQSAEEDIARYIGYWPAPMWIADEYHPYPTLFDKGYYDNGYNIRGKRKAINCKFGRYVAGGQRAVELIDAPSVAGTTLNYTDDDGDGLYETATITVATAVTDKSQIKVYFSGRNGEQEWEIRPIRSLTLSGGIATIVLNSWLLIEPLLLSEYPNSDGFRGIDISTFTNFVSSVDVYREYADTTQPASVFGFEPGVVCGTPACLVSEQNGCLHPRDAYLGQVVPSPATYSEDDAEWSPALWLGGREPDSVRLWYYAGDRSNQFLRGDTVDPLSDWWAQTIAWLATARIERPLCGCTSARDLAETLGEDLSTVRGAETTYYLPGEIMRNPFGTRRGEVMAWRRIHKLVDKKARFAVI